MERFNHFSSNRGKYECANGDPNLFEGSVQRKLLALPPSPLRLPLLHIVSREYKDNDSLYHPGE